VLAAVREISVQYTALTQLKKYYGPFLEADLAHPPDYITQLNQEDHLLAD